ncbi:MAG: gliding motility-associated C-terminal domain-containing protein [Saprospiraceae bacterium]|nr:gliding motility-associated C-terminal domain-containing protein [Saprospiraceae bacterium]MCC7507025.1 gliding motility-associated C-terminal domain-containing protein [Saprospiraceae bacterium]
MSVARCRTLLTAVILLGLRLAGAQTNCPDSLRLDIHPVRCYGLRNGEIIIEKVYGGQAPYYFSLDGISYSTRPEIDRLWGGTYTLYVRDGLGCIFQQEVYVPEPEELVVYIKSSADTVAIGEPFTLRAEIIPEGRPLAEISWRPPSLFAVQDTLVQTLTLSQSTAFAIEVRDHNDCPARANIDVIVSQSNLYFPNAIEPGSNQNGWFTVFAGEGVRRVESLRIFNRNGGLVFEKARFSPNDPVQGWNGRARGKPVQPGVYLWLAEIEYADGHKEKFKGSVTVLRDGY